MCLPVMPQFQLQPTAHCPGRSLHLILTNKLIMFIFDCMYSLTLKVLVMTTDAQWEGMGDVGLVSYEPALLPPCPTIRVLSYSN